MADLQGNQYFVLDDKANRNEQEDALKSNVNSINAIAETVKSLIGPKSMTKMLVDGLGDITVTSDGGKIIEELDIQHPAAKMVVDLSKSIKKNVGDGASSAVVLNSELLSKTLEMIEMNISAVHIYKGYTLALEELKRVIEEISIVANVSDKKLLRQIALTALNTKVQNGKEKIADIVVDCIQKIQENRNDKPIIDLDNIQIIKKHGESVSDTKLIDGIIVDKEVVNAMMPKVIKQGKIALIDGALEIVKTEFSSEIKIQKPEDLDSYLQKEENMIKEYVDAIQSSGANVVFCQKGIDETAQHFLTKHNIMAIRRVKHSDMEKLSRSTGAKIITRIKSINQSDLGSAENISEQKIGKDYMIYVEGCKEQKSITVLIRGGSEHLVDDTERALKNGLSVVKDLIEFPKYVGGGGSIEVELKKRLVSYGQKIGGKEQIPIENYAEAIELIPKIIIENSGKDPLDVLTELRTKVDYSKKAYFGYDSYSNKIVDTVKNGIIEPIAVKKQIYSMATELAILFARIDKIIKNAKKSPKSSS